MFKLFLVVFLCLTVLVITSQEGGDSNENLVGKNSVGRSGGAMLDLKTIEKRKRSAKHKRSGNPGLCKICEGVCAIAEAAPILIPWYLQCLACQTKESECDKIPH